MSAAELQSKDDLLPPLHGFKQRRGLILILSAPSGGGKTTVAEQLLVDDPLLVRSISATTRPPRPGETNGRDYDFMDRSQFSLMLLRKEFLEYAKVFGHYYGTPSAPVNKILESGRDVIFVIDWQGAEQVMEIAREDAVSVFLLPPGLDALRDRLQIRNQDTPEVIEKRMCQAPEQIRHWDQYDYVLVNDDLAATITEMRHILAVERAKRSRLPVLNNLVETLCEQGE